VISKISPANLLTRPSYKPYTKRKRKPRTYACVYSIAVVYRVREQWRSDEIGQTIIIIRSVHSERVISLPLSSIRRARSSRERKEVVRRTGLTWICRGNCGFFRTRDNGSKPPLTVEQPKPIGRSSRLVDAVDRFSIVNAVVFLCVARTPRKSCPCAKSGRCAARWTCTSGRGWRDSAGVPRACRRARKCCRRRTGTPSPTRPDSSRYVTGNHNRGPRVGYVSRQRD